MSKEYFYLKKGGNPKQVWMFFKSRISDVFNEGGCSIILSKYEKRKTVRQRKYAHALISLIAKETGENPLHLKLMIKDRLGLVENIFVNGKYLTIEKSTEKLSSSDYSLFINGILEVVESLNLKIPTKQEFGMD